jgi:hypothetical protein
LNRLGTEKKQKGVLRGVTKQNILSACAAAFAFSRSDLTLYVAIGDTDL